MNKRVLVAVVLTLFIALPAIGNAASKNMNERVQMLEQEIEALKAEQNTEEKTVIKSKFPVDLYGFVAAQFFWGDSTTRLYAGGDQIQGQSSVIFEAPGAINNAWFGATPQNSRVGLDWTGSDVGKNTTLGGKLEIDFLNQGGGVSPRPRIRQLYLDLGGKQWSLLAGQSWDIFSPLNTKTISYGSNLWYQGNIGFRRPQIRFTFNHQFADVNTIKFVASANNPGNLDTILNGGNDSGIPYGEGLIQYNRKMKNGDLLVGLSGIGGRRRNAGAWTGVYGVAGSLTVPFHKFFQLAGEFHYGQALGDFLSYSGNTGPVKTVSGWGQISSRWSKLFETNVGYGIDDIKSSDIAAGTGIANIDRNQIVFGNFKVYPVKAFCIGLEYNYMKTAYKGNGSATANIVMSNFVYNF